MVPVVLMVQIARNDETYRNYWTTLTVSHCRRILEFVTRQMTAGWQIYSGTRRIAVTEKLLHFRNTMGSTNSNIYI